MRLPIKAPLIHQENYLRRGRSESVWTCSSKRTENLWRNQVCSLKSIVRNPERGGGVRGTINLCCASSVKRIINVN